MRPVKVEYLRWNIRKRLLADVDKGDQVEDDESLRKPERESNDQTTRLGNLRLKMRICLFDDDVG